MACVGAYTCSSTNVEALVRESSWFVGYKQGTQALVLRLGQDSCSFESA